MNLAKCWLTSSGRNRGLIVVKMCHHISQQMTSGVKWAEDLNLSVNMHAAKYTGVAQQLDQTNAFRGLCLTFCVCCFLFFFFRHQTSNQEPCVRPIGGERCAEEMLERRHEGQGEAWSCQAPDPTVPNPAYRGAAKVFLVNIVVILIVLILNCRTEDIKKGFKHLGQQIG